MQEKLFDRVAADYVTIHNRSLPPGVHSDEFVAQKAAAIRSWILAGRGSAPFRHLDFGCGNGRLFSQLAACEPLKALIAEGTLQLFGFDTSLKSLEEARRITGGVPVCFESDMRAFPADVRFDLVTCCNVFHHIAPPERAATARTLLDRMHPGARLAIWEHNPLNPLTRVLIRMCPFDEQARLLSLAEARRVFEPHALRFTGFAYVTFFPPRWLRLKVFSRVEQKLSRIPLGAQYWVLFERDDSPVDTVEHV
jgi:SAM-dependent methyltransferase